MPVISIDTNIVGAITPATIAKAKHHSSLGLAKLRLAVGEQVAELANKLSPKLRRIDS